MSDDLRALDRQVAEAMWGKEDWHPLPPFSADTAEGWAAMRTVVERMAEKGWPTWRFTRYTAVEWFCQFQHLGQPSRLTDEEHGRSGPEAVARAAIAALEAKDA